MGFKKYACDSDMYFKCISIKSYKLYNHKLVENTNKRAITTIPLFKRTINHFMYSLLFQILKFKNNYNPNNVDFCIFSLKIIIL